MVQMESAGTAILWKGGVDIKRIWEIAVNVLIEQVCLLLQREERKAENV